MKDASLNQIIVFPYTIPFSMKIKQCFVINTATSFRLLQLNKGGKGSR